MASLWNKKPGRKVQKVEAGVALVKDMGEGGWPGLRGPTRLLQPSSSFPATSEPSLGMLSLLEQRFNELSTGKLSQLEVTQHLAWRIPGTGEPGGLLSMGLHRVGHD